MGAAGKLGIIAGGGALPVRIAAEMAARGEAIHVIRLAGLADPALDAYPGETCAIAEAGRILRSLADAACVRVVLVGAVSRPNFSALKPDWRGAALLPKLLVAAARGDGALLSVLVETLEAEGFEVIGAEAAMRSLAARQGKLGRVAPSPAHLVDIRKAARLLNALGPFDVGQGAVVASGFVLAVEAAEGTDAMLARCALLPEAARGGGVNGVLVKRPKPGQERRVDLPTIGPATILGAHRAGLAGVAIEAGAALIVDLADTLAEADRLGLFVYGFSPEEIAGP